MESLIVQRAAWGALLWETDKGRTFFSIYLFVFTNAEDKGF